MSVGLITPRAIRSLASTFLPLDNYNKSERRIIFSLQFVPPISSGGMEHIMKKHWKFFLITIIWTTLLLLIPMIMNMEYSSNNMLIFYALAGISPSATGIILAYKERNSVYWKSFIRRIINYKQINVKWYIIIFTLIPVTILLSILLDYLMFNSITHFDLILNYIRHPLSLLYFVVFTLVFGPIVEEIGWRGYAIDHLDREYKWIKTSLIIGFYWAVWHLPMFLINGTYQNILINTSKLLFVFYIIEKFSTSIIMYWIYKSTNRSILAGILYHFCINFYGEIFELTTNAMIINTIIQIIISLILVVYFKPKYINDNIKKVRMG